MRQDIIDAYIRNKCNASATARECGVTPKTVLYHVNRYSDNLPKPRKVIFDKREKTKGGRITLSGYELSQIGVLEDNPNVTIRVENNKIIIEKGE